MRQETDRARLIAFMEKLGQTGVMNSTVALDDLPGGDLILAGMEDRSAGRETVNACLVEIVAPRLKRHGFDVPQADEKEGLPEHRLYRLLHDAGHQEPYGPYNALMRTMTSFGRALEARKS